MIPEDRSLIIMSDRLGLHCLPQSYKGTLGLYGLNKERFDSMSLGLSQIIDVTSKAGRSNFYHYARECEFGILKKKKKNLSAVFLTK